MNICDDKNVKVFKMDEYSCFATKWSLEKTVEWYQKNISELDDEEISEIEECDLDTDGVWMETEEVPNIQMTDQKEFGSYKRIDNCLCVYVPYRKAIEKLGDFEEPYEISCTEW